jgi:gamma-glutamyltranspeptidase/glutathione hydrolase
VLLVRDGEHGPVAGEIFRQPDLARTLSKLIEAEKQALASGRNRKQAIYAAYDRFYRGDIAQELVQSVRELGGLFTLADLSEWKVQIEVPVRTNYRGIEVYKLTTWVQGPVLLQSLNILENFDLKALGYNSTRYVHTVYQAMNLAFADRDFYYGDPYFPPAEPVAGLLSKNYAKQRAKLIDPNKNDPKTAPGDPYPFQNAKNPYGHLLQRWHEPRAKNPPAADASSSSGFFAGTTSVIAADKEGWVVSVTPSGGWIPAVIAGKTGIGLSQRMQSFVVDEVENPFNVVAPGKRPRATLTPSLALKDGRPYLAFAVQGGDAQDQNLLQFFLNVVEFGMTPQEAAEAPGFISFQMRGSFEDHEARPGHILLNEATPPWMRKELQGMGYELRFGARTAGPVNAIFIDQKNGTLWGGSSNHGEDYGIAW